MVGNNFTSIDDLVKIHNASRISVNKEAEPITMVEPISLQEKVEHHLEEEVKPFINHRQETIELPPDLKKIGLQPTSTSQFSNYQNIKLPISDDKILTGLHAPITSSLRWLATLAIYMLRQAHLTVKKVHGHVVRVLQK